MKAAKEEGTLDSILVRRLKYMVKQYQYCTGTSSTRQCCASLAGNLDTKSRLANLNLMGIAVGNSENKKTYAKA